MFICVSYKLINFNFLSFLFILLSTICFTIFFFVLFGWKISHYHVLKLRLWILRVKTCAAELSMNYPHCMHYVCMFYKWTSFWNCYDFILILISVFLNLFKCTLYNVFRQKYRFFSFHLFINIKWKVCTARCAYASLVSSVGVFLFLEVFFSSFVLFLCGSNVWMKFAVRSERVSVIVA